MTPAPPADRGRGPDASQAASDHETSGTAAVAFSHFSTHDLSPADQFAAWRVHYAETFDLSIAEGTARSFKAEHRSWQIGELTLTRASMPGTIRRRWRHLSKPRREDWLLVAIPDKPARPVQFRSLVRPFAGSGSDGEVLTLFLARDAFPRERIAFDAVSEEMQAIGLPALAADYVVNLERSLPTVTRARLPELEQITKDLLAAFLLPTAERIERAARPLDGLLEKRAIAEIRRNIATPAFGVADLSRAIGASRSRLYRLLEPYGGVANLIMRERLTEARRRLVAFPDVPISRIAVELGFTDHSSFTRAFRRVFGFTPREIRGDIPGSRREG